MNINNPPTNYDKGPQEPTIIECTDVVKLNADNAELKKRVAQLEEALKHQPCQCQELLKCPDCGADVVEGHDQFAGVWICGPCIKVVTLPKNPDKLCSRCAALSTPADTWFAEQLAAAKREGAREALRKAAQSAYHTIELSSGLYGSIKRTYECVLTKQLEAEAARQEEPHGKV